MKIEHQTPHPDLTFMVRAPLALIAENGRRFDIEAWALNGFAVDDRWGCIPRLGHLNIPFQGIDIGFPVTLRHDADQRFVFFEDLTGRQREALALFYRNLLSGQMAPVGDVITSLDTPVDLVPMGETAEEAKVGERSARSQYARIAAHLIVYLTLAYLVFGVLGGTLWGRVNSIALEHGRVAAPEIALRAVDTGLVYDVRARPGETVAAGDTLVKIRNARRDAEADRADTDVREARAALTDVRAAIARMKELAQPSTTDAIRLAVAAQLHARFFRSSEFEAAQFQWHQMRKTDPELAAAIDPFVLTLTRLAALERARAKALGAAKDVAKSRARAARDLHVVAPVDGVVRGLWAVEGTPVRHGTELVRIETHTARTAVGFADQSLADVLFVGMPAQIAFNERGAVQHAEGTIIDLTAGEDPKRPGAYGIIVTVRPLDPQTPLRTGAPVILTASKNLSRRALSWLKREER